LLIVFAMGGVAFAQQPSASWTIQNTLNDYSVTSYSAANPARGQYSYAVNGTTVQSYVGDLYENLDYSASGANAAISYDIKSLSLGFDSTFLYFRTTVNGNINTGYYYFEIDSVSETDSPLRPDYFMQLQPSPSVLTTTAWSNTNASSLFTVWNDTNTGNSRVGGNNATAPVYDQSGNTISGQSGGSYNNKLTTSATDLYYRVFNATNTATDDGYLDVAVRRSFISLPSSGSAVAGVRATASQSSSIANDKMYIHDWFKPSDLSGMAFDNTNTADVTTWAKVGEAAGPVLAVPTLSGTDVNFGNFRLGANLTQTLTLANTASTTVDNRTQALTTTGTAPSGVSLSGLPTALAAGGTSTLTIGLVSSGAGPQSGTINLSHSSVPGTSATTGTTAVGTSAIAVSGTGWRAASATTTNVFLGKFHVGKSGLSGTSSIDNTATADGYSEGLEISTGTASGGATIGTLPGIIAAGGNGQLPVGLTSVSTVGLNTGTVTLSLQSSGVGTSGLSALSLGTRDVIVTAQGYSGQSTWISTGSNSWGSFDNWDTAGGTPGLDGALSNLDTATFSETTSGPVTVNLNGAEPTLAGLTFSSTSASYTIARGSGGNLRLGTAGSAATVTNSAGNHSITADVSLDQTTDAVTAAGSRLAMEGAVSGTGELTKSGPGTLVLGGTNSYTGATLIEGGIMLINGAQALASGAVTVATSGTLGGRGVVGGATTVESGGTHSPGDSLGVQLFAGGIAYRTGGALLWELFTNTDSLESRGSLFDGVDTTGGLLSIESGATSSLLFNSAGSTVLWSDSFWSLDRRWLVYENVGAPNLGSPAIFDFVNLSPDSGGSSLADIRPDGRFAWENDGNNVFLTYVAVPEPTSCALLATGLCAGIFLRKRERTGGPGA
jgi:autotransporter-associated beta strand protein